MLFVNDVLLFYLCSVYEGQQLKEILEWYYAATRMLINLNKFVIYFPQADSPIMIGLSNIFDIEDLDMKDGIKYLGFTLKPKQYEVKDLKWLLSKIKSRVNLWCNRWI